MRSMTYVSAVAILAFMAFVIGATRWVSQDPPRAGAPQVQVPVSKTLSASALDARIAVARVFGNTVFLSDVTNPKFISVDLNGDGAEDLAVAVTTNPDELGTANTDIANWSVTDVKNVELPDPNAKVYSFHQKHKRIPLQKAQALVAVIHGVGKMGWRAADASQAFLLANLPTSRLSNSGISELTRRGVSLPRTTIYPAHALVAESAGESLAVYWAGAQYAGVPIRKKSVLIASRE
jgi:hypothetical protein